MTRAAGCIDGKPLLIATVPGFIGRLLRERLAAVCRAPYIIAKKGLLLGRLETEIEKIPCLIGFCHWVAAKNAILQDTGERPVYAAISGITPTSLPEVGLDAVKLPPGDHHLVAISGIDGNGRLVGSVAKDIIATSIDVCLVAREHAELRDHSRRSLYFSRRRRRHVVFFQRLVKGRFMDGRQCLSRGGGKGA